MSGRGLVGRRQARSILVLALGLDALVGAVALAAPRSTGPMFDGPPAFPVGLVVVAAGIVLNLLGLAWMVWILRTDPEAHPSWWRAVRKH